MAEPFPTPTTTPKRKRDEDAPPVSPIYTTSRFSFQLSADHPKSSDAEDGSASPHSKVVHKFRGLALGGNSGGGGVAQQQNRAAAAGPGSAAYDPTRDEHKDGRGYGYSDDDPFASRKRIKVPELEMTDVEGDNTTAAIATATTAADALVVIPDPDVKSDPVPTPKSQFTEEDAPTAAATTLPTSAQQHPPQPSLDKLQDPKARGRRRAGTPPLKGRKGTNKTNAASATAGLQQQQEDQEMKTIVDPVRAALTWKEEEITIYDPEDKDDDGTGINGVGFMPTAAMAYARTQKRRLQLAEYKKREESEARARRSQRRRGSGAGLPSKPSAGGSGGGVRKVRFTESEASTVVTNV
ncbi:hypothetical protein JMJ77_0002929 [Colletotrichum scovillei]|uniref:Uncharacterized protein n=1 Tax=Colletotrichum scovillei TaxID=1209932 RepID=A0A9P7QU58_9PEZI|nr:hypothetical protein JMJ78_0006139 [Colletotrichum scovillei]KAG7043223.1 hypothetical protein JMJ77_0002929 [Colletotrichum scovillei]KAG7062670.1 hypothetical protein JMJ76_0009513 [Colletotrichum scovillei]